MTECPRKPVINPAQLTICDTCPWISKKKLFCSHHGFGVRPRIIAPSKKIITPPTKLQMAASFTKAMIKWALKGFKCVSKEEYIKRISECYKCDSRAICPYCKCRMKAKVALATVNCPERKW